MMPLADSQELIYDPSRVLGTSGTSGVPSPSGLGYFQPADQGPARDALKDIVALEVNRQIKHELEPIHAGITILEDGVEQIRHWKLGLWSNGKGGPPGWLELFAKDITSKVDGIQLSVKDLMTAQVVQETKRVEQERIRAEQDKLNVERQQRWTINLGGGMFILSLLMLLATLAKDFHWFH